MTQQTTHSVLFRATKRTHAGGFSATANGPAIRKSPQPNEPTENPLCRHKFNNFRELRFEQSIGPRDSFTERTHAGAFSARSVMRRSYYRTNPPSPSLGGGWVAGGLLGPLRAGACAPWMPSKSRCPAEPWGTSVMEPGFFASPVLSLPHVSNREPLGCGTTGTSRSRIGSYVVLGLGAPPLLVRFDSNVP